MTAAILKSTPAKALRLAVAGMLIATGLAVAATRQAEASVLTSLSLTMSSNASGATGVTHTFKFTTQTDSSVIKGIKFEYCELPSGTCDAPDAHLSITAAAATGDVKAQDGDPNPVGTWTDLTPSPNVLTLTDATGYDPAVDDDIGVVVTDIASNPGTSGDLTPTIFFVRVTTYSDTGLTTEIDHAQLASAVIPEISASGTQDAILDFTVAGVASGGSAAGVTTNVTTGATTLPFGNFVPHTTSQTGVSRKAGHTLTVTTNGVTGYTASVTGTALTRVGGSDTVPWVAADTTPWNEDADPGADTIGLGITATGTGSTFGGEYEPASTALTLATVTAPVVDNETSILYRVQVSATLPAGDYQGSVTYTVLPRF